MDSEVEELFSRSASVFAEFEEGGGIGYIDEAITLDRELLDLCPLGHHRRWDSLNLLSFHLSARYDQLGVIEDIEEAIVAAKESLGLLSEHHPDRSTSLVHIASYLSDRYQRLGTMSDLNEAVDVGQQALALRPPGHPQRSISLNNVATSLHKRYTELGKISDLSEAIALGREALNLRPPGHPLRPLSLNNVAIYISSRYDQLGELADLSDAITLGRQALELLPRNHPDRSLILNTVATQLSSRYKRLGDIVDLSETIVLGRESLELHPPEHPLRPMSLTNLAKYLSDRYNQLGDIADLNEAIVLGKLALDLLPQGHTDRTISLNNVGIYLCDRYQRFGSMTDLNEAIDLGREALELRPPGHPYRPISLNNVGNYLADRYRRLGALADLNEAIVFGREALDLRPPGHPKRPTSLITMASHLLDRYNQTEDLTDLDEAIVFGREVIQLLPPDHPSCSVSLNNIAIELCARYERLGDLSDLTEAIDFGRQALDLRPPGHPLRPTSLNNMASYLSNRYNELGNRVDLDEAITLGKEAIELNPSGHPGRSKSLDRVAQLLRARFIQSNEPEDKEDLFSLYAELAHVPQIVSTSDLWAAKAWVSTAEEFHHPSTVLAYKTSLRLLAQHLTTLPSLPQHLHILKNHTSSLAVDAFSACLSRQCPKEAVELLEQGRGVFWNQISRLRCPLGDVIASGPAGQTLADEFNILTSHIHDVISSHSPDQHEQLCHLNLDLQAVISKIRELPGLTRFLLPPLFSDLQGAASGGPVIIVNASEYSCDALILFFDRDPVHIPLAISKSRVHGLSLELRKLNLRAKLMDTKNDFGRFLRDLWDEIVSPIFHFLQTRVPVHSRIWWCPTAEFSFLPLHAAGPYKKGQRNASHLYISSYTPTLTALIHARRPQPSNSSINGNHFLAIGQANAKGESRLPSVGSELDIVCEHMQGLTTFTRLEGPESCISQVSEGLKMNEWVHFACHGLPNSEQPFDSAFGLHDGHFTIEHLIGCKLENSQFAYLSACHTAIGDEESPDEAIHLASAMQFAGFRSVIGTMWGVDDGLTSKITSRFYENMVDTESGQLDHTRAAYALNKAMNMSRLCDLPLDQRIIYIHIGA